MLLQGSNPWPSAFSSEKPLRPAQTLSGGAFNISEEFSESLGRTHQDRLVASNTRQRTSRRSITIAQFEGGLDAAPGHLALAVDALRVDLE